MDASSLPPEVYRELDALRRRAYGLDADIGEDPIAARRLTELEARLHEPPAPAPARDVRPLTVSDEPDELHDPMRRSTVPLRRRRSWSVPTMVAVIAGAAMLGGAAGLLAAPRGDVVLAATRSSQQERQDLIDQVELESLDMVGARLQSFADFRGLSVWSATGDSGGLCLMVGSARDGMLGMSCTPASLPPSVDLRVGAPVPRDLVGDLPLGTVIRFVLRADEVGVWIARPPDAQR